ncbi:TPA: allophanate hydrolase-related protein, partial [Klebsiella pneumoniae]
VRVAEQGESIALELWQMPLRHFGSFVAAVPPPLGIGTVELADGRLVKGFICEPAGLTNAVDITAFKGWRAYRAAV